MRETPIQIKTDKDFDFCRAAEITIFVYEAKSQNFVTSGFITGGGYLSGFIEVDKIQFETATHLFLTEEC